MQNYVYARRALHVADNWRRASKLKPKCAPVAHYRIRVGAYGDWYGVSHRYVVWDEQGNRYAASRYNCG